MAAFTSRSRTMSDDIIGFETGATLGALIDALEEMPKDAKVVYDFAYFVPTTPT
jgi:ABC-type enterobactin transport system permease subunit